MSDITAVPALDALPLGSVIRNTPPNGYPGPGTLMWVGESSGGRRYYLTNGDSRSAQQVMEWPPISVEWMPGVDRKCELHETVSGTPN